MNAAFVPLVAAGVDWIETLLPVLFVIFWLVSQIVAAIRTVTGGPREAARPDAPRRIDPERPAAPAPAAGGAAPPRGPEDPRRELERQIADFLKGTTDGRRSPPPADRARPPAPAGGRRPEPGDRRGDRRERTVPPPLPSAGRAQGPAVSGGGPAPAAPRLGALAAADPDIARHVDDVFGHGLGQLAPSLGAAAASEPPASAPHPTDGLGGLLRDPRTLRQLILLREVFDRPVERW